MVKAKSRAELKKKIRMAALFFGVVFSIITIRAYFLQILKSSELTKRIQGQHTSRILLTPKRGNITDRNGNELAVSINVESLFAHPHAVEDVRTAAKALASALSRPPEEIEKKLSSQKQFVWVQRKLEGERAEKIKALEIAGVGFVTESKRFYPHGHLAGHLIGFAGIDSKGLEGIELEYESVLKGRSRELKVNRDALGRRLFTEGLSSLETYQGNDVVLTIDKNIQYVAEKELQAAVTLSRAKGGIALVMDPWSGEVLAMAVSPFFNPNRIDAYTPDIWRNRVLTDVYEPGSTFKTFLVAASLEEGMVKPNDLFFCENGSYRVADKIIHDVHPHGWLNVARILKFSSNIGASKIGKYIGMQTFYRYIRKFGFAEATGVQFPSEAIGYVPLPYDCSPHTKSAISFGQGISVTPLQLLTAYAAISNGGVLMRPYMVKKVIDQEGNVVQENKPIVRHRVVSERTALSVKKMLERVVTEGGTGEKAAVEGFRVAGKTGTSQKLESDRKGYCMKKAVASFAGFAPTEAPRVVVLVIIDEPQQMKYGGQIAAPVFSRMCRQILDYLHVVPETVVPVETKSWRQTKVAQPAGETMG